MQDSTISCTSELNFSQLFVCLFLSLFLLKSNSLPLLFLLLKGVKSRQNAEDKGIEIDFSIYLYWEGSELIWNFNFCLLHGDIGY